MAYTVINRGGVYPIFLNKRPVVRCAQDVERTRRDFEYFRRPGTKAALTALLFVYAKLNPGVRYVQGETTMSYGEGVKVHLKLPLFDWGNTHGCV